MRVLIAEDDPVTSILLKATLERWGHDPIMTAEGESALDILTGEAPPRIAILDWVMPKMDGIRVCEEVRARCPESGPYLILLTSRSEPSDVLRALEAGAHDFMTKPFDPGELQARLRVGMRTVELQHALVRRIRELEDANREIQRLQGLLPICSYCKNIRNDHNYWEKVESYFLKNVGVRFTHGICPDCRAAVEAEVFGEQPKPRIAS